MIIITSIVPHEEGWLIAYHCPICKLTELVWHPWSKPPDHGGYWRMEGVCMLAAHNMQIAFARSLPTAFGDFGGSSSAI